MDRCAIFIDAAHLLAEAGKLVCDTRSRASLACDFGPMLTELASMVEEDADLPMLRTYWYDAANEAVPTFEQLRIAELRGVKLRLGRMSRGQQKGVDSLMLCDLTTLAQERAVASMYILGGDDELIHGVRHAQERGIQVTVLGVESTGVRNQSGSLIREADDHIVLSKEFWEKWIRLSPESEGVEVHDVAHDGETAGGRFANAWANKSSQEELLELAEMAPRIPKELDVQLLMTTQRLLDTGQLDRDTKYAARAGFWRAIKRAARGESIPDSEDDLSL